MKRYTTSATRAAIRIIRKTARANDLKPSCRRVRSPIEGLDNGWGAALGSARVVSLSRRQSLVQLADLLLAGGLALRPARLGRPSKK